MADAALDERIREHTVAAHERALAMRSEARALNEAGFHSAAFVWAVRAAEAFMREFVLAPHFMELGHPWAKAMRLGSKVLGNDSWERAFAKAEEWYGPFDRPRTEEDRHAWNVWRSDYLPRRGGLVHGHAVIEADADEAAAAVTFADEMAKWYAVRLTFNQRHPIGRVLFALIEEEQQARRESPEH